MTITIRPADRHDFAEILTLARRSLGWTDRDASFLEWKHLENPFGASPMWVALDGARLAGFRAFLRWEFVDPAGAVVRAARAVDTATDPDYQGRGIFTRLTLEALEQLANHGVELIFNTPNEKSRPGYLKMGWRDVGRLKVAIMPTSWRFAVVVATARNRADRWPLPVTAGWRPADLFDEEGVESLVESQPAYDGLVTHRSLEFLRWRYGHPKLGYRIALLDNECPRYGFAVFRRRRRGRAVEGVLCEVLAPSGHKRARRHLVRRAARMSQADYLITLNRPAITSDPLVRVPGVGPPLMWRPVSEALPRSPTSDSLTMGDVELF